MSIIKRIFGINPDERTDVPNGLRGTGVAGGTGIYDEYFNQMLFEVQADHIIDTEANVKLANDPRGTCYYDSTSTSFLDRNDATVTFSDGDRIVWKGLDTLTASIDISTIDDIEHIMWQGVTIALGSYTLSLGDNQRGELKYSGGPVSIKTGPIQLIDTGSLHEEFRTEGLIINVQSNTTVDADAKSISFYNMSTIPTRIFNLNTTFDITTDLMSGTSEKNSTWYHIWIDSEGNRVLAPDIESTADGTTTGYLVDSGATHATDNVKAGDIVYNLTDRTQTTVSVTPTVDGNDLAVTDDIFVSGDDYKIRMLSPEGLGDYKARIGAAYNNSSGHFDDSFYTQVQEEKRYIGETSATEDFIVSCSPTINTLRGAFVTVKQVNDWTGCGHWYIGGNITPSLTLGTRTTVTLTITGVKFKNLTSFIQYVTGGTDVPSAYISSCYASPNTGNIVLNHASASVAAYAFTLDCLELEKKPTFHE